MKWINGHFTFFDIFFVILAGLPLPVDKKMAVSAIWTNNFRDQSVCNFYGIYIEYQRWTADTIAASIDRWHGLCTKLYNFMLQADDEGNY